MCIFILMIPGSFLTLIAAFEAYRMTSHDTVKQCVVDLYIDFNAFYEASRRDDKVNNLSESSYLWFTVYLIKWC